MTTATRSRAPRRRTRGPVEPRTRFAPLESKLLAPRPRAGLVPRAELVDRLRESAAVPVVSIVAPPGYGKTTLIAQWADADGRLFAWVSLDRSDNDPVELLTYVALALNRVEPLGGPVFAALAARDPAVETVVLPRLGKAVAAISRPFVLVLDDADAIASKPASSALAELVRHLPTGSQLVLASRSEQVLPAGGLRADAALLELGTRDLAFDLRAARALLRAVGVRLLSEDLERVVQKTEGWPAGLYLAALALRGDGTVVTPVEELTGDSGVLADYFGDQVLGRLPRGVARFLMHTSILDRLSGELCDEVLDSSGSAAKLRKLERSNLFLIPLDHRYAWYRYHTLFGEMLRRRLHDREPELELELHARASVWYERHRDPEQAIRHALEAGDVERAGDLVWERLNGYLGQGRRSTIYRWLGAFDEEQIAGYPPLALASAWCSVESQQAGAVERWTAVAAAGSLEGPLSDGTASLESAVRLLRAMTARDGVTRMGRDAARVRELEPESSPWRASACLLEGVALRLCGAAEQARQRLAEGERIAESFGNAKVRALCLGQRALVAVSDADWDAAESLLAQAQQLLEEPGLTESPTMKCMLATSVLLSAHGGRIDEAFGMLPHARRLMARRTQVFPWMEIEARLVLARADLLLAEEVAARTRLRETRALMAQMPDAGSLRDRFEELTALLEAAPDVRVAGPSSLTAAEVRLLHLLPTHLSFREIGERMFLSRNTVKTQAGSIYRKLGSSGRSGAVERARELGLIEV